MTHSESQAYQDKYFQKLDPKFEESDKKILNECFCKMYGWIFIGYIITSIIGLITVLFVDSSENLTESVTATLQPAVITFALLMWFVWLIFVRISSCKVLTAGIFFIIYAITSGLLVGFVSVMFYSDMGGVFNMVIAFVITALPFRGVALFGFVSKKDISGFNVLIIGVIVNVVLVVALYFILGLITNFILPIAITCFFALMAVAKLNVIKNHCAAIGNVADPIKQREALNHAAIFGALVMYTGYVNVFITILTKAGLRRRNV